MPNYEAYKNWLGGWNIDERPDPPDLEPEELGPLLIPAIFAGGYWYLRGLSTPADKIIFLILIVVGIVLGVRHRKAIANILMIVTGAVLGAALLALLGWWIFFSSRGSAPQSALSPTPVPPASASATQESLDGEVSGIEVASAASHSGSTEDAVFRTEADAVKSLVQKPAQRMLPPSQVIAPKEAAATEIAISVDPGGRKGSALVYLDQERLIGEQFDRRDTPGSPIDVHRVSVAGGHHDVLVVIVTTSPKQMAGQAKFQQSIELRPGMNRVSCKAGRPGEVDCTIGVEPEALSSSAGDTDWTTSRTRFVR